MIAHRNVTAVSVTAVHVPAVVVSARIATAVNHSYSSCRSYRFRPFS